ncbi:MAG TPA: hypothetical protein VG738_12470 [Chitinophagaceae bacterium]|nr:hypothetical protein [Chitinophagaceae bacterium]
MDNALKKIITPEVLYALSYFFLGLFLFFLAITFINLFVQKWRYFTGLAVKEKINTLLQKALFTMQEDGTTLYPVYNKQELTLGTNAEKQIAIDELIRIRKNFSGESAENIINLYLALNLKEYSKRKFNSGFWHIKARGIYELYMMEQQDAAREIYKHTNNNNEFVRNEAQTATIHFLGFEGLRFLDTMSTPISNWQQIKLLEQLSALEPGSMGNLANWLNSGNDTVVVFALKLADIYQQFNVYNEVVACLNHKNEQVRWQAIVTLAKIADDTTAGILLSQFFKERFTNKLNIVNHLEPVATDNNLDFLLNVLNDDNHLLKLGAANIISKCCTDGMDIIRQKALLEPNPYEPIYRHIKSLHKA